MTNPIGPRTKIGTRGQASSSRPGARPVEEFCTVSQSVRAGIPFAVSVTAPDGRVLTLDRAESLTEPPPGREAGGFWRPSMLSNTCARTGELFPVLAELFPCSCGKIPVPQKMFPVLWTEPLVRLGLQPPSAAREHQGCAPTARFCWTRSWRLRLARDASFGTRKLLTDVAFVLYLFVSKKGAR